MKIVNPTPDQIPQLRHLWQLAFADTDAFLDLFFAHGFSPARCRCIEEDGQITAALYWFNTQCADQRIAYLYAVATHPDRRGRGLCRRLMEDTRRLLMSQGYHGILLVPQSEPLRAMYRRMGFRDCTAVSEYTALAEDRTLSPRQVTPSEYAALRREYLPPDAVIQEGENLALLSVLSRFYAGDGFLAAVSFEDEKLICREFLGEPDAARGLVHALGFREGTFRIPGSGKPFAQFLPLSEDVRWPSYFGFAFD